MNKRKSFLTGLFIPLIFFFSGFASLIYQVGWQRLLTVYYGVGFTSVIIIVSTYMLGLGLGSYYGGVLAEKKRKIISFYIITEILIGVFGICSPSFLDFLGRT